MRSAAGRVLGRTAGILPMLLLAGLLWPALGSPVRAAGPSLADSRAEVSFGESIEFRVEVTSEAPLARLELRLRFPATLGPYVIDVPPPPPGRQVVRHRLALSGASHLVPNTPIEATWAAFPAPDAEPVLSAPERVRYRDTSREWRSLEGELITVHWYEGGEGFARQALRIGEQAVRDTAALLGVTETERIDFFIYGDEASFRTALGPGTRENVGGQAHADIRTLFALITPEAIDDPWVGIVIPHELVHLVFDTAVRNPYRFPPRWLNEGLAVYLSEGFTAGDRARVEQAVRQRELLPLVALGGQFPADPDRTFLAYAESVSAIDHLVRRHGEDALWNLVRAYRDGLTDDEAFRLALGVDLAAFQDGWLAELGAEAPERHGPRPNPPGPLPPGWSAPGASPEPTTEPGGPTAGTPDPGTPDGGPGSGDAPSQQPAVLLAIAAVVLVILVGLAVARRRTPAP